MTSTTINVASHLAALATIDPDRAAVHFPHGRGRTTLTFQELHTDSDALAHGLSAAGIARGTRTALMVPPSLDFFSLTFALFKVAAVPVMIDPGMGIGNLGNCLDEAEPEAFIGVPKAHLARRLLGWGRRTVRTTVNIARRRFFCTRSLHELREYGASRGPYNPPQVAADDTAAILFTSGSTGVAKGAVYTHGIFSAQVQILKQTYGIDPGEIDLCTFPLFALFGPALGMTSVIPDMDPTRPAQIDPQKAVDAIHRFGVTNLFGSPAVIRRLSELAASPPIWGSVDEAALPTLRRVISAGAPAAAAAIERFTTLLPPQTEVYTPYGATEALPVANIGSREILSQTRHLTDQGRGVCVGRPVAGMTVYVIPIHDDPIPEWQDSLILPPGQIGEFVVRGPVVTQRYYNRDEANRRAKIIDPATGDVLHRMGDVGYLDEQGRLWFCGRKSHRVETPWGTLFTDQVEPIFNTLPQVTRTALVGVTRNGITYPVLCVERLKAEPAPRGQAGEATSSSWNAFLPTLRQTAQRFEHTARIETFLEYGKAFPVDVRHNSKIFREKLAVWADKKLGTHWNPAGNATGPTAPGGGAVS
jgi:acyl-CoA synthetase (AMP-forming)/AMP-acid ligase II